MRWLVRHYAFDVMPHIGKSLPQMFNLVKNLPFNPDPEGHELLKRPFFTLNGLGPGGDCDDKAIVMASWARLNRLDYRFIACGRVEPGLKPGCTSEIPLTHVFVLIKINDRWVVCDPTYAFNSLGRHWKPYDRYQRI